MREIVGACLSKFHDDRDTFELLLAYSDGREIGHVVSRKAAKNIGAEFAKEFDATPSPTHKLVAEVLTVDMDAPLTAVDRLRALAGGSRDIAFEPSDADEILEKLEALEAMLSDIGLVE